MVLMVQTMDDKYIHYKHKKNYIDIQCETDKNGSISPYNRFVKKKKKYVSLIYSL